MLITNDPYSGLISW